MSLLLVIFIKYTEKNLLGNAVAVILNEELLEIKSMRFCSFFF